MTQVNAPEFVRHPKLIAWVEEIAKLTKPAKLNGVTVAQKNINVIST